MRGRCRRCATSRSIIRNDEAFFQFARNTVRRDVRPVSRAAEMRRGRGGGGHKKFDDGLKFEREHVHRLMQTTESKALRHVFFGERAASQDCRTCRKTRRPGRSSRSAVIGARHHGRRHRHEFRQCRHCR